MVRCLEKGDLAMNKKQQLVVEGSTLTTIGIVVHSTVDRDFAFYLAVGMLIWGMVSFYRAHKMEVE